VLIKSFCSIQISTLKRGISSLELVFLEEHGNRVNRLLHIFMLITYYKGLFLNNVLHLNTISIGKMNLIRTKMFIYM